MAGHYGVRYSCQPKNWRKLTFIWGFEVIVITHYAHANENWHLEKPEGLESPVTSKITF